MFAKSVNAWPWQKLFCSFESAKMHCEFTYTTNAFQDESWDLSNSKGYEHSFNKQTLAPFLSL